MQPPWNISLASVRPFELYKRTGRLDWNWSTETLWPGTKSFFLSSIFVYLFLTTVWVLVCRRLSLPHCQDTHFTLSQLETYFGLFTSNLPVLSRKRTWLNPIWARRKCYCSSSLWSAVRFLLCFMIPQMASSRTDAVHCWAWLIWDDWIGRLLRWLYCIVEVWRSGWLWYPFTLGLTINSANLSSPSNPEWFCNDMGFPSSVWISWGGTNRCFN